MDRLTVLNACLGTMGETPLNSINDPHTMRFAALQLLDNESRRIQAKGRWYNMERISLQPSSTDSRIYVPGDAISFRAKTKNVVIRGRTLYDLGSFSKDEDGSPLFTESVEGLLIRLVKFDELPESAAAYISASTVLRFQRAYDGDSTKTRQLAVEEQEARVEENTDHIRNRKSNLIDSNERLQRLKFVTRNARRLIRS